MSTKEFAFLVSIIIPLIGVVTWIALGIISCFLLFSPAYEVEKIGLMLMIFFLSIGGFAIAHYNNH